MPLLPPCGEKSKTWRVGTLTYTTGGLIILFAWLLFGDFAWSMRDRSVGPLAQWYLKHLGASNLLYTLILGSFPAVVGLFLGPVISYKSDRHRGRFGRRIPFLLVATPLAAIGMIGIGFSQIFGRWIHMALGPLSPGDQASALVAFGISWAAFEAGTVISTSVFGGLVNDVVPRELIGRFYGLFRAVSLLGGILFNYWIIGHVDNHFTLIIVILGSLYGIGFLIVCLRIREGEYPPPPEPPRRGPVGSVSDGIRTYMRECFTNPYYIGIFVMMAMGMIAFVPVNIFSVPFARSVNMSMDVYGKCVALVFLVSLFLSYFIGWMSDIFHPVRTSMVLLGCYVLVAVWGSLFAVGTTMFAIAFVSHGVLSGAYFTSSASIGQRLFPSAKFAQFASAAGVFVSISTMLIGPAIGLLIDATDNNYRYSYVAGGLLAFVGLLASFGVYAKFQQLGGVKNYAPPE